MTDDKLRAALNEIRCQVDSLRAAGTIGPNVHGAIIGSVHDAEAALAASATGEGPTVLEQMQARDQPKYGGANCPIGFCTATEICPHRPAVPALDEVTVAVQRLRVSKPPQPYSDRRGGYLDAIEDVLDILREYAALSPKEPTE